MTNLYDARLGIMRRLKTEMLNLIVEMDNEHPGVTPKEAFAAWDKLYPGKSPFKNNFWFWDKKKNKQAVAALGVGASNVSSLLYR